MSPDVFPRFTPGQHDEPVVQLPHARMRHMVARVLTEGGIEGITVEKIDGQLPASAANDFHGAEHVVTTVATAEAGEAYEVALARAYAKLGELETRHASHTSLRVGLPDGTNETAYLHFGALAIVREAEVRRHLTEFILPQLARRYGATH